MKREPCSPEQIGARVRSIRIHRNERGFADGLEFFGRSQILFLRRSSIDLFSKRFRCAIEAQQRAQRLMLYWWMRGIEKRIENEHVPTAKPLSRSSDDAEPPTSD